MAFSSSTSRLRALPGITPELAGPACPFCCLRLELVSAPLRVEVGYRLERAPARSEEPQIGVCRRCRVVFEDVNAQLGSYDLIRQRMLVAIYRTRRARDLFDRRKGNVREAMSELAEAYACLEGQPGVRPFAPHRLHEWVCEGDLSASQRDCVAFVLHVHDATADWTVRFDVVAAMQRWDAAERAVFVEWAQCPWWA